MRRQISLFLFYLLTKQTYTRVSDIVLQSRSECVSNYLTDIAMTVPLSDQLSRAGGEDGAGGDDRIAREQRTRCVSDRIGNLYLHFGSPGCVPLVSFTNFTFTATAARRSFALAFESCPRREAPQCRNFKREYRHSRHRRVQTSKSIL